MSFNDNKLETAIAGVAIILLVGLGYLFKAPVQSALGYQEVSYEMPRPKKSFLASLFDLGDREIDRKYVNPFAKKEAAAKKAEAAKQNTAAVKPAPAKNKTAKATTPDAKKNVSVQVTGSDPSVDLGGFDSRSDYSAPANNYAEGTGKNNKDKTQQTAEEKAGLTADQWRALLQAQPTKQNVAKLVAAYAAQEIDDSTFYTITSELLRSNNAEVQGLGLNAVKSFYNLRSFAMISQYFNQLPVELQQQAHAHLLTYAVSGRLGILLSALQSRDLSTVTSATQIIMEGHQKAKEGVVVSADPRSQRGDVTLNSVSGYSKFLPILQQLAQNPDTAISGLASSAYGQIQGSVAAL